MKKFITLFLFAVMLSSLLSLCVFAEDKVSVWDGTKAASIEKGAGTENDPFVITKASELAYIAAECMGGEKYEGKFFKLDKDINWNGKDWTAIGYATTAVFGGNFDGNGKTIFNLKCEDVVVGIFGCATNAVIKNLNVDYATFTTSDRYAGAIIGLMRDCTVSGCGAGENVVVTSTDIMANTAQMGGLFGLVNAGKAENCVFNGQVQANCITGTSFVGGIAGVIGNEGQVSMCINNGTVSVPNASSAEGKYAHCGGIAGGLGSSKKPGTISNCINTGDVTAVEYAGGVTGKIHVKGSVISGCYSTGAVTSNEGFAGAAIGFAANTADVQKCTGTASASAKDACAAAGQGVDISGYSVAGADDIKNAAEYKNIEGTVSANLPVFEKVNPEIVPIPETTPAETTPEETTPEETTPAPETTPETTRAPETTSETTPAPEKPKKGCGGALECGFALIAANLCAAVILKRNKKK